MPVPKAQEVVLRRNVDRAEKRSSVPSCLRCRNYRLTGAEIRWVLKCRQHQRVSKVLQYITRSYWETAETNAVGCDDFDGAI